MRYEFMIECFGFSLTGLPILSCELWFSFLSDTYKVIMSWDF